ncbi:MAG: hypothetical protein KJN95_11050 [Gammaproteobacteria bacterium]|nr:hypothetical protein [Gammaproteobacteria bacterium]
MQSKPGKLKIAAVLGTIAVWAAGSLQWVQASELSTLFTTPGERQVINSNRYKTEVDTPTGPVEVDESLQPVQLLMQEEITRQYRVSGITLSKDGPHTVWINTQAYEDGDRLEDKSKIKVLVGNEIKVRITTPDGKQHYATSGETLEVTYLATVEN